MQSGRLLRLTANVLGSLIARCANLVAVAVTVPLTLHTLGQDQYAAYAIMASIAVLFAFSDLGIGLSVVNPVASATDAQTLRTARYAISQAWTIQLLIGGCTAALGCLGSLALPWVLTSSRPEAIYAWGVMFVAVGIGIATGLGQRVYFALGRNLEGNVWLIMGRALAVIGSYVCAWNGAGLVGFVAALQGIPAIVSVVMLFYLFIVSRPDLAPRLSDFDRLSAKRQLGTGVLFLILNLAAFCDLGIDAAILGLVASPAIVTSYDLTSKPFFYVTSLSGILLFPVWPFIAQEIAEGRAPSARLLRCTFAGLAAAAAIIGSVACIWIDDIVHWWAGAQPLPGKLTPALLTLNTVLISWGMLQSMILNARGYISQQARVQIVFLICFLPIKIILAACFGPIGMVSALTLVYVPRLFYVHFKLLDGLRSFD